MTLQSVHGRLLSEGAGVSVRSLQAFWPNKMNTETVIAWSDLAKLSTQAVSFTGWLYNLQTSVQNKNKGPLF